MKRFYITGTSGTGKTTVAKELKARGIPALDLDKEDGLCYWAHRETGENANTRWDPSKGDEFLKTHRYVCDTEKLEKLMDAYKDTHDAVVVVGLADNQPEIFKLFDKVFLFHCSEEVFLKRIDERTNRFGKFEPERSMILNRYHLIEDEALAHGAVAISVDRPVEELMDEVIKNF